MLDELMHLLEIHEMLICLIILWVEDMNTLANECGWNFIVKKKYFRGLKWVLSIILWLCWYSNVTELRLMKKGIKQEYEKICFEVAKKWKEKKKNCSKTSQISWNKKWSKVKKMSKWKQELNIS